jgi:hypothetical protein
MLSVAIFYCCAECIYAECLYAEFRDANLGAGAIKTFTVVIVTAGL